MGSWARVARVAKTRNLEGNLVVEPTAGFPFVLSAGMQVYFVPPALKGPRMATVTEVTPFKGDSHLVVFDAVSTRDQAEQLVGSYCLVARDALPEIDYAEAPFALVGWCVRDDAFGDLGTVDDILESPAQAILVVTGQHGEVLIPVVDEFIRDIDEGSQLICVSIPNGLLHLSSGDAR